MNCNAIYRENGQIELLYPIRLRCLPVKIQVIIPDELIDTEIGELDPVLIEAHAMLGADYSYVSSGKVDRDILMEALEDKYCR
jgi:hypothetical protein